MRLTKLEHACVRLESQGAVLVIDPGIWTGPDDLDGADAILVTHEHFDHLDADRVRGFLAANPAARLWTNASVASQFGGINGFGDRVRAVAHGDTFTAAGFDVHVYGAQHAALHRDMPVVANTGFAINGAVFHPGDALTVPEDPVATLLLPANAPWLKLSELIDYARAVGPQRAYAIHDGLLNARGLAGLENWLKIAAEPVGGTFTRLAPGTSVDL
jgi:L-ascorbate metabolism protein UlaG (beta-lactamase superfamily)